MHYGNLAEQNTQVRFINVCSVSVTTMIFILCYLHNA
jgi:hypothetical protein